MQKSLLILLHLILIGNFGRAQNYTTEIDTFYVPSPEYSSTIGLDSLHFPCAITRPTVGTKFPVLILVHGTSELDYDANSTKDFLDSVGANYRKAQTRMFYEIADSLSRNGIMVLRYDKRSFTVNCIEKPACWFADTVTPYDYIKDVHYAVDFAKTLPTVDTCNIFLAGHSQGGSFVSQVGFDRPDIRGVLNMAGTAQPIDSVSIYQKEFVDSDPTGAQIIRQQFDSLRLGLWPMTDTLYENHFSPRFWLDWISHTDSAVLVQKTSDKPTALMYCSIDKFVPPSIHYQIWQDSVTRPDVTFELFNNLDHSFGTEYDSTMSPQVLEFMTDWILQTMVNCISGISELNLDQQLSLYPNPSSNWITLESKLIGRNEFRLLDLSGKLISKGKLKENEPYSLDIRELENGVYFIEIGSSTKRFVKH